jgi:hypothetical protein
MPTWVRGEDTPFVICSVAGTDVFLFPSSSDPRVLLPRPHYLPEQPITKEMVFTFRTPDGELIGTDFGRTDMIETISNTVKYTDNSWGIASGILQSLSGVRVKFRDDDKYHPRVYSSNGNGLKIDIPPSENNVPIESALGNLRSSWAISLFLTW